MVAASAAAADIPVQSSIGPVCSTTAVSSFISHLKAFSQRPCPRLGRVALSMAPVHRCVSLVVAAYDASHVTQDYWIVAVSASE